MIVAFAQGWHAFKNEGLAASNPFQHGTRAYDDWVDGWLSALHGEPLPERPFYRTLAEIRMAGLPPDEEVEEEDRFLEHD